MKYCILSFLLFAYTSLFAQNKEVIDSLLKVSNSNISNRAKVNVYINIAVQYSDSDSINTAKYANKAINLANQIDYERGKITAFYQIALVNLELGYYAQSQEVYQKIITDSKKINFLGAEAFALNDLGIIQEYQGNYEKALEYYFKSLKVKEALGSKLWVASSYTNIGIVYKNQGNYGKALEYYFKSLRITEELGNKQKLAISYNNIGTIYNIQGNYKKALEYYSKSLKIDKELENQAGIANGYNNIGLIHANQGNYEKALEYYSKSLKIDKQLGSKNRIARTYSNVGDIYAIFDNDKKAIEYQLQSLEIYKELGVKDDITYPLLGLGKIYRKQKEWELSRKYLIQCLDFANKTGFSEKIRDATKELALLEQSVGNYKDAYEYQILFKQMSDSLFNAEQTKKLTSLELNYTFEQEKDSIQFVNQAKQSILEKDIELQKIETERQKNAKLALEKQAEADRLLALARQEKDKRKQDSLRSLAKQKQLETDKLKAKEKQLEAESKARKIELAKEKESREFQQYINYLVIAGFISLFIFAFFMYRSRQKQRKANQKLAEQNEEITQQAEEIKTVNEELNTANEEVRTANENLQVTLNTVEYQRDEILSSIQYAQRIQSSILPRTEYLNALLPECFVFYKPRDVVSGDFYYLEEGEGKIIFSAIDCTGHGVPGAFMSMVGNDLLNTIIKEKQIFQADRILTQLHKDIRQTLKQEDNQNRDGMDMALVVIDKEKKTLDFVGAKNPLVYIQNNELKVIKGDKMSIGGEQREEQRIFTSHKIDISQPTTFYMFSDGFQDQFGGEKRKKFMVRRFRELLFEIHEKPMQEQQSILEETLNTWKGKEEQIDDILVVGVKV